MKPLVCLIGNLPGESATLIRSGVDLTGEASVFIGRCHIEEPAGESLIPSI